MAFKNNYLDFHAEKGTGFLHPGGPALTELLIKELVPVKDLRVLEVGCGTGATLVHLTKNYQTQSTAVDFSDKMLKSAKQRAWWGGVLGRIHFKKISGNGLLPFPDNSFDAVYSESVLAIVDEAILPHLVKEIARVLVPGGKFISNDAIWKDSSTPSDIERINTACLRDFGIVQSISKPAYKKEWISYFEAANLELLKVTNKHHLPTSEHRVSVVNFFRIYKLLQFIFNPILLIRKREFERLLKLSHQYDGDFLDSYLFIIKKPSD